MTPDLSSNTQAILLLTAPLIAGRGSSSVDLLSPSEYARVARRMRDMQRQPADLLSSDAVDLLRDFRSVIDETRLQRLLARGFLLSQVIERWQARAIWVQSRADANYPRRLKARLREDAPAVLYGCGDVNLLDTGGLAVVGSRNVDDVLIDYTRSVGRLVANAGRTLVSGGARGIDQAAMLGALEGGGKVVGVLADSLEKGAMDRENRDMLMGGQLLLISSCDPSAGFHVGNAMRRNKLIYALADAALVVSSDFNKGGTWAGATEQLDRFRAVPVYVRSTGEASVGLDALRKKGAIPWPNPQDVDAFNDIFELATSITRQTRQIGLSLDSDDASRRSIVDVAPAAASEHSSVPAAAEQPMPPMAAVRGDFGTAATANDKRNLADHPKADSRSDYRLARTQVRPADALFAAVRQVLQPLLISPMKDAEVASTLDVSLAQARAWLQRLVDEGVLERRKKPSGYVSKQSRLFG
jgi:DNA processing protein